MGSRQIYRQPWGLLVPMGETLDPKLNKRLTWVTACTSAEAFMIQSFEDFKTHKFRVFIRIASVREYVEHEGVFLWESKRFGYKTIKEIPDPEFPWNFTLREVPVEHCYYLGQYPYYWDVHAKTLVGPLGERPVGPQTEAVKKLLTSGIPPWPTTKTFSPKFTVFGVEVGGGTTTPVPVFIPFPMAPTYPLTEYGGYENVPLDDIRFFLGDHIADTWEEQKAVVEFIKNRFINCLARNYPKPIIQRTIKTPQGPADWPGVPMKDLEMPVPSPPFDIPVGAPLVKRKATVWFGILPPGGPEGLLCRVIIY